MPNEFTVTVLGTGTSQGVPVIGCQCEVCQSKNPKDKRLRSSILFRWKGENFAIDSGPDFRQQMLREDIRSLRAVLYTHEHKDHVAGLDDVRAFNYLDQRDMELFCSNRVAKTLKSEFHYAFGNNLYPGVPRININLIDNHPFTLPNGPKVIPIQALHYRLPIFGFRIGSFAYLTDIKTIPEEELEKLIGVETLIIDCLREGPPHLSHLVLEEALLFIEFIQPKKSYLTHISHNFGTHEYIESILPEHISPAYDGLKLVVK